MGEGGLSKGKTALGKEEGFKIQGKLHCIESIVHIIRWHLVLVNLKVNSDL